MHSETESIPENRTLSPEEYRLARWMLENGEPLARGFLSQLNRVRVVSRCSCGCASIDFAIDGREAAPGSLHVLADFLFGSTDDPGEAILFERHGQLAGLEVYMFARNGPERLPTSEMLRPTDNPTAA